MTREIVLQAPYSGSNPHAPAVISELERMRNQRVRVFRTVARLGDSSCVTFKTTSKDIHLRLGAMTDTGRSGLGRLLEVEFASDDCDELLIYESSERGRAILVMQVSRATTNVVYSLSFAS